MKARATLEFVKTIDSIVNVRQAHEDEKRRINLMYAPVHGEQAKLRNSCAKECRMWADQVHAWVCGFINSQLGYDLRQQLMTPKDADGWVTLADLKLAYECWNGHHVVRHQLEINLDPNPATARYRYTEYVERVADPDELGDARVTYDPPFNDPYGLITKVSPQFLSELAPMTTDHRIYDEFGRHLQDRRRAIIRGR